MTIVESADGTVSPPGTGGSLRAPDGGSGAVTISPARPASLFWRCVILAVVYAVLAKVALRLGFAHPSATAVWPPTGIALAALLVWGSRVWPGIFVGAFVANLLTAGSIATSLGIAVGNTLEAVVGCYLVTRFAGGRAAFERTADTLKFVGLAGLIGPAVSATCGVTSLALGGYAGWARYGTIWITWWLGDLGGAVLVTPFLVLWSTRPRIAWTWSRVRDVLVAQSLAIAFGVALFGGWVPSSDRFKFLAIPFLVWVAFRLGRRATATAVVVLSGVAVWGTLSGFGSFAGEAPNVALVLLQGYLSVVAVTALTLAVAIAERARAERALRKEAADRERAQETLRAASRFRDLLESAPDAMVIADGRGTIVLINSQAEKLFGYTRGELIGQDVEVLVPERSRQRHVVHRTEYTTGPRARPMGAGLELHGLRRDGSTFPVEISLSPIQTEEGPLISSAIRDVSGRKRVEETVTRLAALVQASRDAIFSKNLDGIILSWNAGAERLYGYEAKEMEGESVALLMPPGKDTELQELLDDLRRGMTVESYETTRRRKDGRLVEVSLTISPIRDTAGRIIAGSVVARDITARKRADEALREINRRLEGYVATVSHDLRAPLRQVATLADVIMEDYGDALDETGRHYARRLADVVGRMEALTRNLLDYSRVRHGDLPLVPVSLDEVVADARAQLEAEIQSRGARVVAPPNLPPVLAHPVTLALVVVNLLGNAIKFVRPGVTPEVHIRAEDRGEWIRVWLEDNGIGIDSRFHERIFQAFERLHGIDTYSGNGLGLAIVREGMDLMGGRVGVESDTGRGSRFWVELRKGRA